jgi:hypothetical protein
MTLQSIVLTLQYCLETFEESCGCGRCLPCTRGQNDIKEAIQTLETLIHRSAEVSADTPSVQYSLERKDTRVEFFDRPALSQFVRELIPSTVLLGEDATNHEIAAMAATRNWTLIEYQPGEYVQPSVLLQSALNTLQDLLLTTELNMDDLEPETRQAILRAADFENLCALQGFLHEETGCL